MLLAQVDTERIHRSGQLPPSSGYQRGVRMRLDLISPTKVELTLSRRNLLALLAFLDNPQSGEEPLLVFLDPEKGLLAVNAEEDQPHYANRSHPPGRMPAHIEARLPRATSETEVPPSDGGEPCA